MTKIVISKDSSPRIDRIKWGHDHIELLIRREQLDHWRSLRKTWNGVTFPTAVDDWNLTERGVFLKRLKQGWLPDLVSSCPEILHLRLSKGDVHLMAAALAHDIAYAEGGGIIDRFKADWNLAMNVIKNNGDLPFRARWFVRIVVAPLMFLGVRLGGWNRHFCWGQKPEPLPDPVKPDNTFEI